MKRIIALVFVLVIAALCFVLPISATSLDDGVYEVSVELRHKEKDKLSTGNKYINSVAKLEVENGKQTVTIVLPETMDNMVFWYYLDGSVQGDTSEAKEVSNVTVGGKTYEQGFEFPLMTTTGEVGVKFKVPVMPMNPSAKLRLDYSSIKVISQKTTITTVVKNTSATSTVTTVKQSTQKETSTEASTISTTVFETTSQQKSEVLTTVSTTHSKTTSVSASEVETKEASPKSVWVIIAAVVIIAIVAAAVMINKRH